MINLSCHTSTPFSHTTTHAHTHPPQSYLHTIPTYYYCLVFHYIQSLSSLIFDGNIKSKRSKHRSSLKAVRIDPLCTSIKRIQAGTKIGLTFLMQDCNYKNESPILFFLPTLFSTVLLFVTCDPQRIGTPQTTGSLNRLPFEKHLHF